MNTLKFGNGEWYGKKDTILAYNDENSNFKPLPFNFDRASSATVINKDGLIETVGSGEPRIDYKDDSKGALLLEPQRTNQMINSEDLTSWSKQGATTISLENINNPVNSTNANLITVDSNGIYANRTTPNASSVYAISFWLYKNNNIGNILLDNAQGGTYGKWEINLDLLPNSFVRIDKSHPSVNVLYEFTTLASGDIAPFFKSPEGTKSFYVTGFQLEQGSYATSYIPTQGSIGTRVAESSLQGGFQDKNIFGSTQGTALFEFVWDELNYIFNFNVGGVEVIRIFNDNYTQWRIRDTISSTWYYTGFTATKGQKTKIALRWSGTEIIAFQNGVKSTNVGTLGSNIAVESITQNNLNNTSNIQFYNTALTDQELINLTTI